MSYASIVPEVIIGAGLCTILPPNYREVAFSEAGVSAPEVSAVLCRSMADRFDVVGVRIKDEGPIVARMVLRAKPRTTVVAPARRDGRLVEGINGGALGGEGEGEGEGDVEGLAYLALGDPELRLAPLPKSCRQGAGGCMISS
jgi:hypothetical protein